MIYKCENIECSDIGKEYNIKTESTDSEFVNGVMIPKSKKCPVCKQSMEVVVEFKKFGWKKPMSDRSKRYYEK